MKKKIIACPRCLEPVEVSDMVGRGFGFLDRRFKCSKCRYVGLPIELHEEK